MGRRSSSPTPSLAPSLHLSIALAAPERGGRHGCCAEHRNRASFSLAVAFAASQPHPHPLVCPSSKSLHRRDGPIAEPDSRQAPLPSCRWRSRPAPHGPPLAKVRWAMAMACHSMAIGPSSAGHHGCPDRPTSPSPTCYARKKREGGG
jgi:hypothetical protein